MRFRSLLAVCAFPLAATGVVYGCAGVPAPEDLCAWLQNPDPASVNCVANFHDDIKDKCGALDLAPVTGTFGTREALDMCVLTSKGGAVVFDPPIDLVKFPPVIPTTMTLVNADGTSCGEIAYLNKFSWSLKIAAPVDAGAGGGSSTGQGGGFSDNEPHYTQGTISVSNPRDQSIQVVCPAPNVVPNGELAVGETHNFNLNQVLASTAADGCPQYAEIIPQAILELDPGGVQRAGSVRLRIQFPPQAKAATSGAGGATTGAGGSTSTGSTVVTPVPDIVYYFDCNIPSAPLICANGLKEVSETDVDCGGPESTPNCPARCSVGQLCINDCDCDADTTCEIDLKAGGMKKCTAPLMGLPVKGVCGGIICANKTKDNSESDIDCGGLCSPCMNGQHCNVNTDCIENSCTLGLCGPPTCKDKATNGVETDVDCGGTLCPKCADGKKCNDSSDCMTGGCSPAGVCSSCYNTAKDGAETGMNCGGPTCPKCGEGMPCIVKTDCEANVCSAGMCNGCSDLIKNGKETDLDCGGPVCPKCADGKTCTAATDCTSKGCLNGMCSPCADGVQDGDESDVDCGGTGNSGGVMCPRCANGKVCAQTSDCANGNCDGFKCGSCSDGLLDGNETDIDCGGSCPGCAESKVCLKGTDCALGVCDVPPMSTTSSSSTSTGGVNTTPGVCNTCTDMMTDGNETDKDCGGATCKKCVVGEVCKVNIDCMSGICINKLCK